MMTARGDAVTRIYTKQGDQGLSSLFGGDPVSKADLRLEAYGNIDELNSVLGLARCELGSLLDLTNTQNYLFTIGSHLACGDESLRSRLPPLDSQKTSDLEMQIDGLQAQLPELKQFILPGGSKAAAWLHLARTVCRRAERAVVRVQQEVHELDPSIVTYLNRLGDFLFVAARYCNLKMEISDLPWQKNP